MAFGLPPGLTLAGSSGKLVGDPSGSGTFAVIVIATATHGNGAASSSYTLKIGA